MKFLLVGLGLFLVGAAGYSLATHRLSADGADAPPAAQSVATASPPAAPVGFAQVPAGEFDPLSVPMETGIVWYGTWEDAMAEKERTGKPVMLHFGSPRCPSQDVCVPGTW